LEKLSFKSFITQAQHSSACRFVKKKSHLHWTGFFSKKFNRGISPANDPDRPSASPPQPLQPSRTSSPIPSSPAQPPCSPAPTYPKPSQHGSKISPTVHHRCALEPPTCRGLPSPATPQTAPSSPPTTFARRRHHSSPSTSSRPGCLCPVRFEV
jgi:hypothetical protein